MKYNTIIGRGRERWKSTYTPSQSKVLGDFDHSEILQTGSYRSGKTETGARAAIRHALSFRDARVGIFRATRASLTSTTLVTVLELVFPEKVEQWSNVELALRFDNGSTIEFYGCDYPDRLGSLNLSMAFVDEAAEVSQESLGMIAGRLSLPLNPCPHVPVNWLPYQQAIFNGDNRQLILATNPKSKSHPLYHSFVQNPQGTQTSIPSTVFDNPHLGVNYLYSLTSRFLRSPKPTQWVRDTVDAIVSCPVGSDERSGLSLMEHLTPLGQRNLLGQWVALEGAIYDLDADTQTLPHSDIPRFERYIAGVDFGFHNPRVVVVGVHGQSLRTIAYWHKGAGASIVDAMVVINQQYPLYAVYVPHDQPAISRDLRNAGIKVQKADVKVLDGIDRTATLINNGTLKFVKGANFPLFWAEMEGYQWMPTKDGSLSDAPIKANDHYPDALRYCVHSYLKRNSLTPFQPEDPDESFRDVRPSPGYLGF